VSFIKFFVLVALFSLIALAQRAEPKKIQFRKGSSSATRQGVLSGSQDMEYEVTGRRRQLLLLKLTADPANSLDLTVMSSQQTLALQRAGSSAWSVFLPRDGDYEIRVVRRKNIKPTSKYQLRVTIR